MLWEVAYGVCHEALHLNSLEDFNATEVDLMDMKNNILAMWKSRDRRRTSSLRPIHLLICRLQGARVHLGKKPLLLEGLLHLSVPFMVLVTAWARHHCPSSSLWPHHLGFHLPLGYHIVYKSFCPQVIPWWEHPWSITSTP